MQIFIDHIGYILITLLAGMAIGWKSYPLYRRFIDSVRGEQASRVPVDRD